MTILKTLVHHIPLWMFIYAMAYIVHLWHVKKLVQNYKLANFLCEVYCWN